VASTGKKGPPSKANSQIAKDETAFDPFGGTNEGSSVMATKAWCILIPPFADFPSE
jgi:hypothetical protein